MQLKSYWFEHIHSSIQYYLLRINVKKKNQCYVTQFLNPGKKKMIKRDIVPTLSEIPFLDNDRKTKLKVKKQIK